MKNKQRIAGHLKGIGLAIVLVSTILMQGNKEVKAESSQSSTPASAKAATSSSNWCDYADTSWYDENKENFTITNASQLAGLANLVNGGKNFYEKTITLGANISLNSGTISPSNTELRKWTPIGAGHTFSGTFDGNGKTISGLYYSGSHAYIGLFGQLLSKENVTDKTTNSKQVAKIKNLTIDQACVVVESESSQRLYVSALVGKNQGGFIEGVTVKNSTCEIAGKSSLFMGALTGMSNNGIVKGCTADTVTLKGSVKSGPSDIGGAVGYANDSTGIYNVTVTRGNVHSAATQARAGGICGYGFMSVDADSTRGIEQCVVKDTAVDAAAHEGTSTSIADVGGVIGFNCLGPIESTKVEGGSVTGKADHVVYAGGIVGQNGSENIVNCNSNTKVTVLDQGQDKDALITIGGIVGYHTYYYKKADKYTIGVLENCLSTSTLAQYSKKENSYVGAIVGAMEEESVSSDRDPNTVASRCYYLNTTAPIPGSTVIDDDKLLTSIRGMEAKTSSQLSSGEVAYQLNNDGKAWAWTQEGYPQLIMNTNKKPTKRVQLKADGSVVATRYTNSAGKIALPSGPSKSNRKFIGWYMSNTCISANTVYDKDTVLEARYQSYLNKVASFKLDNTSFDYNGKNRKPGVTVKNGKQKLVANRDYTVSYSNCKKVGYGRVTVKGKGSYTGEKTLTYRIYPQKAKLSTVKSKRVRSLTVTWKKDSQATGYQVLISTNKSFTKNVKKSTISKMKTTSKVFTSLKRRTTYYVKVRSYKQVDGKRFYGSYSSVKKIKVK